MEGATSYSIKKASKAGGPYTVLAVVLNTTTYIDTEVTNGTAYYYVISAINKSGESENSNEVLVTPTAKQDSGSTGSINNNQFSNNQVTNNGTVNGIINNGVIIFPSSSIDLETVLRYLFPIKNQ